MLTQRLFFLASTQTAFLLAVTGCGSNTSDQKADFETDPAVLKAALENPIISCQEARRECISNADDADARATCNDELANCLRAAADRATATATALTECREQGRSCVAGGGGLSDCRSDYEACTQAAIDGTDPDTDPDTDADDAGSDSDDDDDDDDSFDGGVSEPKPEKPVTPSMPGLPSLDGGLLDGLPRPVSCIAELRLCVAVDLSKASECAAEARLCLSN